MSPNIRRSCRLLLAVALSAAGLSACSDDGGTAEPDGFAFEAARACTDALNDVDIAVAVTGSDANFALLEAAVKDEPIDADEAVAHADDLDAYREELVGVRDALASIEPDDDADGAAWDEIVASLDGRIELMERRADLARSSDGSLDVRDFEPGGDAVSDEFGAAIEELDLVGRDCEVLPGWVPAPGSTEFADFLADGSSACTTIVSRRRAEGYSSDRVIDVLAQVLEGEEVEITSDLEDDLDALVDEWDRTLADLEAVDVGDLPADDAWRDVLDAAAERADVFRQRAEAVADEDQDAIAELFAPGVWEHPGFEWDAVGLAHRDCRSIEA